MISITSEKRKEWIKKYRPNISPDGFEANYCSSEHVYRVLTTPIGDTFDIVDDTEYFVGFDGTKKTYEELTEEEKQDLEEQYEKWKNNLPNLVEKFHRSVERYKGHDKER